VQVELSRKQSLWGYPTIPPLILNLIQKTFIPFRFQRITRRQGGGDEAYFTYVEEADDDANKVSQRKRIGIIITRKISSQENIVTLAKNEHSEVRSVSGTIPVAG
jgi:hypothetical protein